jgi:hypothetical protein
VEFFAGRLRVEVGAAFALAEDFLPVRAFLILWMDFISATIDVKRPVASHELGHGPVSVIDERSFEVDLHPFVGVVNDGLHGVRCFPKARAKKVVTDRGRRGWLGKIEIPMNDVHPMDHQVGEDSAAEIPEPAPFDHAVGIERLVGRVAEKPLPINECGVDFDVAGASWLVSIPREMDFSNRAKLSRTKDLPSLLQVWHTSLLHADLNDDAALFLRLKDRVSLGKVVREGFLHVDVFAGSAGINRDRHMMMIGSRDQDSVDIGSLEKFSMIGRDKGAGAGHLCRGKTIGFEDIADGRDLDAGHLFQFVDQGSASAAVSDDAEANCLVGDISERCSISTGPPSAAGQCCLDERSPIHVAVLFPGSDSERNAKTVMFTRRSSLQVFLSQFHPFLSERRRWVEQAPMFEIEAGFIESLLGSGFRNESPQWI